MSLKRVAEPRRPWRSLRIPDIPGALPGPLRDPFPAGPLPVCAALSASGIPVLPPANGVCVLRNLRKNFKAGFELPSRAGPRSTGPCPRAAIGTDAVVPSLRESGADLFPAQKSLQGEAPTPRVRTQSPQTAPSSSPSCPHGERGKESLPACPQTAGTASGAPQRPAPASPLPQPQPQPLGRFYGSRYQMSIIGSEKQQTL